MKLIRKLALVASISALAHGVAYAQVPGLGAFGPIGVTPTVQNAAYSSGNAMGGWQSVALFASPSYASATLDEVQIASKGGSTAAMTIYAFTKAPASTCTDKSAFSLAAADIPNMAPGFPFVLTPAIVGAGSTATFARSAAQISIKNSDLVQIDGAAVNPAVGTINLYVCIVADASVTPASTSDLTLSFGGHFQE